LARALVSAAALRRGCGDVAAARAALEESLAIFEEVGTLDEPGRVRRALALLDGETLPGEQVSHPSQGREGGLKWTRSRTRPPWPQWQKRSKRSTRRSSCCWLNRNPKRSEPQTHAFRGR